MKTTSTIVLAMFAAAAAATTGCVMTGTHEAAIAAELEKQAALQAKFDTTTTNLEERNTSLESCSGRATVLDGKLTSALSQNQTLVDKVASMGQNVEQLLGEKDTLATQRARLAAEIEEVKRMREVAEARNSEFKKLLGKLAKMVDAGTLQIKIRKGRMLVTMSSDVLFSPGRATLKPQATEAIEELAATIAGFPDRKFQVIGHSDASPIRTPRFPSNWELSSQRAIEVVKLMVEAGVPPEMLSAAGSAEFDPIAENVDDEGKALNRRVELIFVPKIDELPGFDELLQN